MHWRVTSLLDGRILYVFLSAVFSKQYSIKLCYRPIFPCLLNICETLNAFFSKQYLDDIGPFSYAMLYAL